MRHAQTCACGALIRVQAKDAGVVQAAVAAWECRHAGCTRLGLPAGRGEQAALEAALIGFHPQPDHDGQRTCGVSA